MRWMVWVALAGTFLADGRALAPGPWGSEQAILEVTTDGADVEFECARGRITKPVVLDTHGDFDLPGIFTPEGHGPTRDAADPREAEARYRGHVGGDAMTLTMTQGERRLGPYTLRRDQRPTLRKCR
jgi:hypothetical protein